jgi:hypothetical protein
MIRCYSSTNAPWMMKIVHLLVSTATMNRLHLEHMRNLRGDPNELSFQPLDATCGQLHPDARSEEHDPLAFREACNKIIHADVVELFDPSRPVLRLMGRQRGKEWLALVELIDYERASFRNFEDALS